MEQPRPRVAVIGSGVAGLTAAHALSATHEVTLFEADDRFGGHAHTHDVLDATGARVAVDSGFIVHNRRTYPTLLRLFDELDVPTQASEMTMSVHCDGCGLEYAGGGGPRGLLATPSVADPRYLRMLTEILRFHRQARRVLASDRLDTLTLGGFLDSGGYSPYFVRHFMLPFVSAVWSAGPSTSLEYPARYLFTFLSNHGLLAVGGSPQWRTVTGGSRTYVERVTARLGDARRATGVRALARHPDGVEVVDDAGRIHDVDQVVVATHADDALALLVDPTPAEKEVLGAFSYSRNETLLHRDTAVLPRHRAARAAWNYRLSSCTAGERGERTALSYDMNVLQRLSTQDTYVVTLNQTARVDPDAVIARMSYTHPVYTAESVAAQARLGELNDGRTAFAGAYHGWGFHEDGCLAGARAARSLGGRW